MSYAATAPIYYEAGWSPLPLPARQKTSPPVGTTGADGIWPNLEDVEQWCRTNGSGNVALRVPEGVIGIDVDDYDDKRGGQTLAKLEADYGPLPPTWVSTSRGFGVSSIRLYRVPKGVKFPGALGDHIEVIQYHHRYIVAAPSLHPNGERYRWYDPTGERARRPPNIDELAELPTTWVEGLKLKPNTPPAVDAFQRPQAPHYDGDTSLQDYIREHYDWHRLLTADGWTLDEVKNDRTLWRRPGKDHDHSATLFEPDGPLVVFTNHMAEMRREWAEVRGRDSDYWVYGLFGYIAATRYNGDLRECGRDHRRKINDEHASEVAPLIAASEPAPAATLPGDVADNSIWYERDVLAHILQAARSRLVSPYAVLGCVLARVAAFTPPSSCLPPVIGSYAPLSLYIALRGASGAGKSSPSSCAADLLPNVPPGCVGPLPLGSGEGLVDAYMELIEETDGGGKKTKTKRQTKHGALFTLDEGQMLAEIGSRKGSTILPVLRTAWSGGDPGQANASIETRRSLRAGSYHLGLISLWQDKAGAALIADADGGTPQRFVWLPTNDPGASKNRPKWPGPLDWKPPAAIAIAGRTEPNPLGIDPDIEDEVVEARVAALRGEDENANPLDAHRRLNKLKVAGVLAILDNRHSITQDDWRLAERILNLSDSIRDWVIAESRRVAAAQVVADANKYAFRESVVEKTARERALMRAAKAVWRAAADAADGASRRDMARRIAGRDREHVTVDDAIAEAQRRGWIEGSDDYGWRAGESKPS